MYVWVDHWSRIPQKLSIIQRLFYHLSDRTLKGLLNHIQLNLTDFVTLVLIPETSPAYEPLRDPGIDLKDLIFF